MTRFIGTALLVAAVVLSIWALVAASDGKSATLAGPPVIAYHGCKTDNLPDISFTCYHVAGVTQIVMEHAVKGKPNNFGEEGAKLSLFLDCMDGQKVLSWTVHEKFSRKVNAKTNPVAARLLRTSVCDITVTLAFLPSNASGRWMAMWPPKIWVLQTSPSAGR